MVLDARVEQRLRHSGIIHFAMAVATITNQVDDNIGMEGLPIVSSNGGHTQHGGFVLCVDMEDWNRQPLRHVRRKTRSI
jgi:hypothetical protein